MTDVAILIGSTSDMEVAEKATKLLDDFTVFH
jgi:phosphoribosylcarboxyaminoimidazole (NCAIR) mutase